MTSCPEFLATLQIISEQESMSELDKIAKHLKVDEGFKLWPECWKEATREMFRRRIETLKILAKFPPIGTGNCAEADSPPSSSSVGQTGSSS